MRTVRKFTPSLLDRFVREQRGEGTRAEFAPWHQVTRSEPSSHGRSHLIPYSGRHLNLLSDEERGAVLFSLLCGGEDLLEQFPLSLEDAEHELARYDARYTNRTCPGTLKLFREAGIRHPQTYERDRVGPWVLTTDALLVLRSSGELRLLAVSSKNKDCFTNRELQLLSMERAYWHARRVPWLLVTPSCYDGLVRECLECTWPWHLLRDRIDVDEALLRALLGFCQGHTLTRVFQWLAAHAGWSQEDAQCAFWQGVWRRQIPLNLRRTWRPHVPVHLLPCELFDALNPVQSGRSAWK